MLVQGFGREGKAGTHVRLDYLRLYGILEHQKLPQTTEVTSKLSFRPALHSPIRDLAPRAVDGCRGYDHNHGTRQLSLPNACMEFHFYFESLSRFHRFR